VQQAVQHGTADTPSAPEVREASQAAPQDRQEEKGPPAAGAKCAPVPTDPEGEQYFRRVADVPPVVIDQPDDIPEGQLRIQDGDGRVLALPLAHTSVEAEVSGHLTRVWVTQYFTNPLAHPIEAVYVFPLPQMAAVDDMEMHIGERVIRGDMKRREEARQVYEEARRQGKTASLLEQERPNIFTQSVANILPGDKIRIRIRYVEDLKYEDGGYEFTFPMVVGPRFMPGTASGKRGTGWSGDTDQVPDASRISPPSLKPGERSGHDIAVTLRIDAGVPVEEIKSPSHDIQVDKKSKSTAEVTLAPHDTLPNKDLIVRFRTAGKRLETAALFHSSDLGRFFMLIFQPEASPRAENIAARELVFVLDCSGSMSGSPITKSKEAMRIALKAMREGDTFQIIKFSDHARGFAKAPVPNTPDNLKRALQFIDQMRGTGGTQMIEGIKAALDYPVADGRLRIVAFMTDGYIGNDTQILAEVEKRIQPNTRLFSFGIGSSVNRYLLDRMSEVGRGYVTYVRQDEPADKAIERFYRRIETPVLVDIDIKVDKGKVELEEMFPARLPDLFAGQPLVVFGRYKGHGKATVSVTGKRGTNPFRQDLKLSFPEDDERNSVLGTLWARNRIRYFMDKMVHGEDQDIVAQVVELAIKFRIMSRYTSFVAVEETVRNEGGKQETITVPVDVPEGVSYEGVFGSAPATGQGYGMGGGGLAPVRAKSVTVVNGSLYETPADTAGGRFSRDRGNRKGLAKERAFIVVEPEASEAGAGDSLQGIPAGRDPVGPKPGKDDDKNAMTLRIQSFVVLSGPLSEKDVRQVLEAKLSHMTGELSKTAGLTTGLYQFTLEIDEKGIPTPKASQVLSNRSGSSDKVLAALQDLLKKLRFPAGSKVSVVKVTLEIR
jgi:Ca-activated chloride channel family protein